MAKRQDDYSLDDLVRKWGRSKSTIRGWIYKLAILKSLPSSGGKGSGGLGRSGLRFSRAEVKRFERTHPDKLGGQPRREAS